MKTKKSGIYVALTAAVLIIAAILITTCIEPITGFNPPEKETVFPQIPKDFVPTKGKGVVQFVIADEVGGRIILPDVTLGSDFKEFDLYIYVDKDDLGLPGGANGTSGVYDPGIDIQYYDLTILPNQPVRVLKAGLNYPIELPAGDYFFKFDAYHYDVGTSVILTGTIAATGMSGVKTVIPDASNTVTIPLAAVGITNGGNGRFDYRFVYPPISGLSSATMSITPKTPGGTTVAAAPISQSATFVEQPLVAGYYQIDFVLNQANYQTRYFAETLYIYEGMTTTATIELPELNNIRYALSFTFGDGRSTDPETATTTHGTTLGAFLTANSAFDDPAHDTTPADLRFNGWYLNSTDATNGTNKLANTYQFIKNNLALYAGWTAGTRLVFTPAYNNDAGEGIAPTVTPSVTGFDHSDGVASITFTVANSGDYVITSWHKSTSGTIPSETGSSLVLTIGIDELAAGDFTVTVFATHTPTGGKLVNTATTITVGTN